MRLALVFCALALALSAAAQSGQPHPSASPAQGDLPYAEPPQPPAPPQAPRAPSRIQPIPGTQPPRAVEPRPRPLRPTAPPAPGVGEDEEENAADYPGVDSQGFVNASVRRYTETLKNFIAETPTFPAAAPALGDPAAPPEAPPAPAPEAAPATETVPEAAPAVRVPFPPLQAARGVTQVGGETLPALSLHPEGIQQASATFEKVELPKRRSPWQRLFLVTRFGLADPLFEPSIVAPLVEAVGTPASIPALATPQPDIEIGLHPALMQVVVLVNNEAVFSAPVADHRWEPCAIDLTRFAGLTVSLTFRASTLGPLDTKSVASFGQPVLLTEQGPFYVSEGGRGRSFGFGSTALSRGTAGIAFAQVRCEEASQVRLSLGDAATDFLLDPGNHWLPLVFKSAGPFSFTALDGDAKLHRLDLAPFTPPGDPLERNLPEMATGPTPELP